MHWDGRAIDPAAFHITLAFLGNVPVDDIPRLLKLADRMAFPACSLTLDVSGRFKRARVGWLGCTEVPGLLLEFQALLVSRLGAGGFETDSRHWKPHITLYRNLRKPCANIDIEAVRWELEGFCLMQSLQDRNGVSYRSIGRWKTGK